ncbi:IF-2B-domain-containing protein [Saitoella complicata NRRL Y-17804]|uniref:Translation initiation factor eIF2B subunit beta n=1 Tax=Saitoella complicata (strain BCRC 22490 / CBS 7301 / JCM 7358 / NBRC 10748 / NRRL Y-17804) TaxID=698492 RepID=A0A0E9NR99_SAICN|nr:IF-2B-domain-containing protein [Saitoella complicata NRRL Y-17804]ODQ54709.1 IF-2B-domain-containing protein [Saitoella complicata NRRL Y-17804]GAO51940.1 hypothetical protein G7K_6028-t1 [Saitoella complicata NRRL Y-17804]
MSNVNAAVESLAARLKRKQIRGSHNVALETALVLRQVVSNARWSNQDQLVDQVKEIGRRLVKAAPRELACGNVVRRILRVIREEYRELRELIGETAPFTPMTPATIAPDNFQFDRLTLSPIVSNMFHPSNGAQPAKSMTSRQEQQHFDLKPQIIQGIQEFIDELKTIYENISAQALDHIHSNEIIMTHASSKTVESFLRHAAKKRKFTVILAEAMPNDLKPTHSMATTLSKAGIDVIVIPESAVFAMMSRVNKVLLGTHSVLANGGLLASSGARMIAAAAQRHSIPVVCCTGLYKLSPMYPHDVESFMELVSPEKVLGFEEGDLIDKVEVINPYYDYVSPELVQLYITNLGGHPPSYLYRLVGDHYDAVDTVL